MGGPGRSHLEHRLELWRRLDGRTAGCVRRGAGRGAHPLLPRGVGRHLILHRITPPGAPAPETRNGSRPKATPVPYSDRLAQTPTLIRAKPWMLRPAPATTLATVSLLSL